MLKGIGPKRQRLTRREWKAQQAAQQAILVAERAAKAEAVLSKQQQARVMLHIEGREVGLLRKQRLYDRAELGRVRDRAFAEGITLREAAVRLGFLTAEAFDRIVRPEKMVGPIEK